MFLVNHSTASAAQHYMECTTVLAVASVVVAALAASGAVAGTVVVAVLAASGAVAGALAAGDCP